jgi:tetratricopeptide (TPR) repeat protein
MPCKGFDRTAVFCRPWQLREAAVTLSCIPSDAVVPLVVLDPPPLSRSAYGELYSAYTEAREASMKNVIGLEYRGAAGNVNFEKTMADIRRHGELREQLSGPRSWLVHNRRWRELLAAIPCERAVFLFHPTEDDLTIWRPSPVRDEFGRSSSLDDPEALVSLLPAGAKTIELAATDGESLTDVAWVELNGTPVPAGAVTAEGNDPVSILIGLHEALERKVPLRVGNTAPVRNFASAGAGGAAEAIVVEATESAGSIAGVLYACHRRAALAVYPAPDPHPVQGAIDRFIQAQREANETIRKAAVPEIAGEDELKRSARLLDFINKIVNGDWRGEALKAIEDVVSSSVPEEVVECVADRPVTVFTSAIPYSFVRRGTHDWSRKPIGHIASDAPLMVAIDVFEESRAEPEAPFAAVFDPGFFETEETRDVTAAIEERPAHLLVFQKGAATLSALLTASHLPLEFLFFNTHGNDDSIKLGEQQVESTDLVQWLTLPSAPVVFNNSCLSWTGVGREFVRVGARGYIGTLWPVGVKTAARFAAQTMAELIRGVPVAEAIRRAVVDDPTFMAYIYVGTVRVCALARNDGLEKGTQKYSLEALDSLLELLLYAKDDLTHEMDRPVAAYLYSEVEALMKRQELLEAPPAALYPLGLEQLRTLVAYAQRLPEQDKNVEGIAAECLRLLAVRKLPTEEDKKELSQILLLRGQARQAYGNITGAIEDYDASSEADPAGESSQPLYRLNLSDLLKRADQWNRAKEVAMAAKRQADEAGSREVSMRLSGVLGQIERRLGKHAEALEYARAGFAQAVELKDRGEQAEFKLDEARALLLLNRTDEALAAANAAGEIARAASDTSHDLDSFGVLAQIHHRRGDAAASRECAQRGYLIAKRLRDAYGQASFLMDLGAAEELDGHAGEALRYFGQSLVLGFQSGRFETLLPLVLRMGRLATESRDWNLIHYVLRQILGLQSAVPEPVRRALISAALPMLRTAASIGPAQVARDAIGRLLNDCSALLSRVAPDSNWELNVIGYTLQMLSTWLAGSEGAAPMAEQLDQTVTRIALDWKSLVAGQPPS